MLGQLIESHSQKKKNEHDNNAWMMWHGALIPRLKTFPPLSDFMSGKKAVKIIDEAAIMARLTEYNKRVKECQSSQN